MTTTTRLQTVMPYLYYRDGVRAIEFLCSAFGFREQTRDVRGDGTLNHGEVVHGGDLIMLGTPQRPDGGPAVEAGHDSSMYCYVANADRHCQAAREAGAEIVDEPADLPYGRVYCAADPEGRRWYFCQAPERSR